MTVKTILVCLTTKEHSEELMKVAVPLARRCDAHLVGLHTLEALHIYPGIAMHVTPEIMASLTNSQKDEASSIEEIFIAHTKAEDFVSEFRLLRAQATTASKRMIESARAADLVIMAQEDKESDRHDQQDAQANVIRQSGRPVIIVPSGYDGPEIGRKFIVGWSDTREATRAVHDMLLLATPDTEIELLSVRKNAEDELRDSDLLEMTTSLARRGYQVSVRHVEAIDQSIADVLMSVAFEQGADLIVTGAFGHSNIYDFVIGATSRALLRNANLPVLYSK